MERRTVVTNRLVTLLAATQLAIVGCQRRSDSVAVRAVDAGTHEATHFVDVALRCGECHDAIEQEWRTSAHARSLESPLFRALRPVASEIDCDRCHAPFASTPGVSAEVSGEGVTCDVCHTVRRVEPGPLESRVTFATGDVVKYGSLCDAVDHYYHRMGCSPLHGEGELCAACHLFIRRLPTGEALPIFTEYLEWLETSQAIACQECHMPVEEGRVAQGAEIRTRRPHHGLLGFAHDLRRRALSMSVGEPSFVRDGLDVTVRLVNDGAGHSVPTGLPERRLELVVRALDARGRTIAEHTQRFGRVLIDEDGIPSPFFAAVALESDTRIGAGEKRDVVLHLATRDARTLDVELAWLDVAPEIAERVGFTGARRVILARQRTDVVAAR